MRSFHDRPTFRSPVGPRLAGALFLAAVLATSCVDGNSPLGPTGNGPVVQFALTYESYGSVAAEPQPINRIRATVVDVASGAIIGTPQVFDVDASQPSWDIPVEVDIQEGGSRQVQVVLELIHVGAGGAETVEWSGRTRPLTVTAQAKQTVQQVSVYRGPPQNLDVTGVVVADPARTRMVEGESLSLTATVEGSGSAQLFWSSLDPTVASVDADGAVTGLLPGQARIVAAAGPRADTVTFSVLQRLAGVRLTPDTLLLDAVGGTGSIQAAAVDPRGGVVDGVTVTWSVLEPGVAEHLGGGEFRGLRNGRTPVTVSAVRDDPVAVDGPASAAAQDTAVRATGAVVVRQAVASVDARPESMAFTAVGDQDQATAEARDAGGTPVVDAVFQWRTRDDGVAIVDADGVVESVGNGATWIVASSGSAADSIRVRVDQEPARITLRPQRDTLRFRGETLQLTATVVDARGVAIPGGSFTWASSAPAVASVDASGRVTAGDEGTALIAASSGGLADTATVVVAPRVDRIVVSPDTIRLASLGARAAFRAVLLDAGGDTLRTRTPSWSVSDPDVATIDETGTATPLASGTTVVTASLDGASDTGVLVVRQSVASVDARPDSLVFRFIGETGQATAQVLDPGGEPVPDAPLSWTSRNEAVATVDADGGVVAQGAGTTWLVASSSGASDSVKVRVSPVAARVAVSPESATLSAFRQTLQLTVSTWDSRDNPITGRPATFVSSDPAVASVNTDGQVTALANGRTTITATVDGVSGNATVVVAQAPAGVRVFPTSSTIPASGGTTTLTAYVVDALGNVVEGASVAWSSSEPAVASVASSGPLSGLVTGGHPGTAIITARASNGVSGGASVVVESTEAVGVDVRPDPLEMFWGDEQPLSAVGVSDGGFDTELPVGAEVFWISRNETIAWVDEATGVVSGLAPGETWVVAVVSDPATETEWTDSARVTVVEGPPAEVVVEPATATATYMSDVLEYTATVYDAFGHQVEGGEVVWGIADPSVARLADPYLTATASVVTGYPNGYTYVEPVANGSTAVTASFTRDGATVQGEAEVVVDVAVSFLYVSVGEGLFFDGLGQTEDLGAATTAYDNNEDLIPHPELSWSSDDPDVVTVDPVTGLATAVGTGTTWVHVTAPGLSEPVSIWAEVVQMPASVEILDPVFQVVDVGETGRFRAAVVDVFGDPVADPDLYWELDSDGAEVEPASLTHTGVDATGPFADVTGVAPGASYLIASADSYYYYETAAPGPQPVEYIYGPVDVGGVVVLGPTSLFSTAWVGGDPKAVVTPGQTITVPVMLDLSRVSANGDLGSLQFEIYYESDVLTFVDDAVGSALSGASVETNLVAPGYYRFAMANTTPLGNGELLLVELTFTVASGAPAVAGPEGVSLSDGYYVTALDLHYPETPTPTDPNAEVLYEAPVSVGGLILIDDGGPS